MSLNELLKRAVDDNASDVFIIAGRGLSYKVNGVIKEIDSEIVMPDISERMIREIFDIADRNIDKYIETGDDDFSVTIRGLSRFRVSVYKQRGSFAAVIRIVPFGIPDYKKLGIGENVMDVVNKTKGLILVTGPAGGGKSTTLACMIDRINHSRNSHIITLEEPIEYLHRNDKSIISQREIEFDTMDYVSALRASLRQAPDVILVGEMRDYETISTAMTAAETGHLVISTLHTVGASNTVDRIIDVFPANQQPQIRVQLAMLLQAIVSQQLVPTVDGGLVPVFEIMYANNAIRNMIRESKTHQLNATIVSSASEGMISMDNSLLELYKKGVISKDIAIRYALNPDNLSKRIEL
ncbi:type IV pilus twitching motility protein PilT [Anaerofustis stercorihominis]|uniref:type IV pilus twitching motility protein PilT n=1 Tax=Anaerofustis stercorihominis TaxID=214853 RepID=UPI00214CFAB2|nr:PilT/PilU family type 4a pilus ATPase [uncultured Anaerofustis sp.]MCR2032244.1 PilT/PilU family type 4a pilus ATPase [Anaerofustis stercorihominis]